MKIQTQPSSLRVLNAKSLGERGFSILELLIAMAILMLLVGMLFSMFGKASDAWLNSEANVDRQRNSRLMLEIMNRELSSALVTSGAPNSTIKFFGSSNAVYFVAPIPPAPSYQSDLAGFGYVFTPNAGGSPTNVLRYFTDPSQAAWTPTLLRQDPPALSFTNSYGSTNLLAENILDLQFLYYSNNDAYGTNLWSSAPSGAQPGRMPTVIEVRTVTMDSRSARMLSRLPSPSSQTNFILRNSRTNIMVIHTFQAQ